MKKCLILIFAFLIQLYYSQIRIKSPYEVRNKFRNGQISVECLNCAKLNDVIETSAHLYYSPLCAPFAEKEFNDDKPAFAVIDRPETIYLANRPLNYTDCFPSLYNHINYLQSKGFKLVMVMVDKPKDKLKDSLLDFYLWDDTTIPVVIVSKEEIDLFFDKLNSTTSANERIEVEVDKKLLESDVIKIDGWSLLDTEFKPLVNLLNDFKKEIKDKTIQFIPHYMTYDFPWKEYLTANQCVCDYKYCLLWGSNATANLYQHLIQYCVYEYAESKFASDPTLYLKYMNEYFTQMNTTDFSPQTIVEDTLNIKWAPIEDCYKSSFVPELTDISKCTKQYTNRILEKNKLDYLSYKQSIYVNDRPVRVNSSPQYIKELICAMLGHRHVDACKGTNKQPKEEDSQWLLIVGIVVVIVIINVVIFFMCRRYTSKRLHERIDEREISDKVNTFIVNYSKFKDEFK